MPLDCLRTAGALEIAVHAWDISQSCGQCLPIPDEPANDLLEQARLLVPRLGRYPLFAAPAPAPPRSTSSDRLTAYLGRPVRDKDLLVQDERSPASPPPTVGPPRTTHRRPCVRCDPTGKQLPLVLL